MNKIYSIGGYVRIGYSPEHKARKFNFDIAPYLAMWPNTTPRMLVQRCGDVSTYIADTTLDGTIITWLVNRYDTDKVGAGSMWVAFFGNEDEQLGLTPETKVSIEDGPPSINGYIPPETVMPWVQRVLQAADRVEDVAKLIKDFAAEPLVVSAKTKEEFPPVGNIDAIYKAIEERKLYQWNEESRQYDPFVESGSSITELDEINGGDASGNMGGIVVTELALIHGGNSNGKT